MSEGKTSGPDRVSETSILAFAEPGSCAETRQKKRAAFLIYRLPPSQDSECNFTRGKTPVIATLTGPRRAHPPPTLRSFPRPFYLPAATPRFLLSTMHQREGQREPAARLLTSGELPAVSFVLSYKQPPLRIDEEGLRKGWYLPNR